MLSTGILKLLLCKSVQQVIQKINVVANNIFSSSAWTVLENSHYNIAVKEFYLQSRTVFANPGLQAVAKEKAHKIFFFLINIK